MSFSLIDLIVPCIVTPYTITIGLIALYRIKTLKRKREGIVFFFLSLFTAFWAFANLVNPYVREYGYITAILLINTAVYYTILLTRIKFWKIFETITILCSLLVFYFIVTGRAKTPDFGKLFGVLMYPLLLIMNGIVYFAGIKRKSRFLISLGIMSTIMILGGAYETFRRILEWPMLPTTTIGGFGFVCIGGYHLIVKGYLSGSTWSDYIKALEKTEATLREQNIILKKTQTDTVFVLSQTIEAKDPYTRGHCARVREIAKAIAAELHFESERRYRLELSAMLHDIGKIGIPGVILNKPGPLTGKEMQSIKFHPDIGADILKNVDYFKPLVTIIRYHHERIDGMGYPAGLAGEDIPLESRIIAIGDVFDAMTTDRPYRRAIALEETLRIMQKVAGTQLDANLVRIFIEKKIYLIDTGDTPKLLVEFEVPE